MRSLLSKFFKFGDTKPPKEIAVINSFEEELKSLSDEEIKSESLKLKQFAQNGGDLYEILPRAFALVREAARRTLNQRHFDVQLWGGIVLHSGAIAEMFTGEGKTLTATSPTYLNALNGKGVHVVTVNDYLAKRDAVWMGQVYYFLGLTTACILHDSAFIYDPSWKVIKEDPEKIDKERDQKGAFMVQMDYLRPISRKEAYLADIVYGTNHEFGFDYLRDNLAHSLESRVQRDLNFAIIDEVDSILIDEARTPLIISVPDKESSEFYKVFARAVRNLKKDEDYVVDEKLRSVEILESGIDKIEAFTGIRDLYAAENIRLVHFLEASLKAHALFHRDKDYVVRDGEIVIVDQFTGRLMLGRRYSAGLHQAIEAKEGVLVKEETRTYAQISIQNYFRLYNKISGMTGTAQTSAEEFHKVYKLEVHTIPSNKQFIREDLPDLVFKNTETKYRAIAEDVRERHKKGQPVLIGTVSIEKNEMLGKALRDAGLPFEMLNAKNHEREGGIIAQAGRLGAVTVATNMAGRGVDILLGGNPPDKAEAEKVKELGGLHVIGTERHEARRIDNQLRGRAGRQGDPGSSQFFLSLDDDLLRVFGGDRIKNLMERFKLDDNIPMSGLVTKSIAQAQSRVEGFNFDARKHLLEYDDVLNKQRINFYGRRLQILNNLSNADEIKRTITESFERYAEKFNGPDIEADEIAKIAVGAGILGEEEAKSHTDPEKLYNGAGKDELINAVRSAFEKKVSELKEPAQVGRQILGVMDMLWMNHLEDIEALTESVRMRAYAQKDPLVEYRRESYKLFEDMKANFDGWVFTNFFKIETFAASAQTAAPKVNVNAAQFKDVGRNDPCPCGSGKKFKQCHGK